MAQGDKPYRVYRGGRVKGKVPLKSRPETDGKRRRREPAAPKPVRPGGRPRWGRRAGMALGLLLLLSIVWAILGFLAVRSGVSSANERLPDATRAALTPQSGLLLNEPTTVLLLGTDGDPALESRADARRADSILLVRTDPGRHRLAYLSIPRDLRVEIPGYGAGKINSAYQIGGAELALKTVKAFTRIEVNHVVMVDFANFRESIDALGGITVNVPAPIVSNRFDCPFSAERCASWKGWRFEKGEQEMNGRRALVYARIRENQLNTAETDLTRGERQQAVVEALSDKLTGPGTFLRLPFVGGDLVKPLTTDMSATQLVQLGWVRFRADEDRSLHCRLGGTASSIGGESVLIATEENFAVMSMFTGASAPQPPLPGSGPFGPGCAVGRDVR